jgi:DNA-binding LacI/PurR family transcriptional regulator
VSRPTIHDVAEAAGVSVTTVSHALNGKGRVDPATRARVAQVVGRLGYRANRHAQGLRSGRSWSLGLLLPVTGDVRSDETLRLDFYMRLAGAAAATAFSRDNALMLLPPGLAGPELRGFTMDGGMLADPSPRDQKVRVALEGMGRPVVTIGRDPARPDDPWYVANENDSNTRLMLDHLVTQGARRIALLVPKAGWSWATETRAAYESWTREHRAPRLVVPVSMQPGEQSAFEAAQRLLSARTPPDAIFAVAARFVRGVVRAANACGRQVPGELLLAAGVDGAHAREGDPPITALELHPERQAEAAVEMLLARLNGEQPQAPAYIQATLHERASTGVRATLSERIP